MKLQDFFEWIVSYLSEQGVTAQVVAKKFDLPLEDAEALMRLDERARFGALLKLLHGLKSGLVDIDDATPNSVIKHLDRLREKNKIKKNRWGELAGLSRTYPFDLLRNPNCEPHVRTVLSLAAAAECELLVRHPATAHAEPRPPAAPKSPSPSSIAAAPPSPFGQSAPPADPPAQAGTAHPSPGPLSPLDPRVLDPWGGFELPSMSSLIEQQQKREPSSPPRRAAPSRPAVPKEMEPEFFHFTPRYTADDEDWDDDLFQSPPPAENLKASGPVASPAAEQPPAASPPASPTPQSRPTYTAPPAVPMARMPVFTPDTSVPPPPAPVRKEQARRNQLIMWGTAATTALGGTALLSMQSSDNRGAAQGILAGVGGTTGAAGLACEKGSATGDALTGGGSGLVLAAMIDAALVKLRKGREKR